MVRTVWLLDVNNIRGKIGFPPLADFSREVEHWSASLGGDVLVVLAVDCGRQALAFALSPTLVVVFSGVGGGCKDADTIIAHSTDFLLRSHSHSVVRVVTSDRLLRDRCQHHLPDPPKIATPVGALRSASQLARLRLEVRSEGFETCLQRAHAAKPGNEVKPGDGPFGASVGSARRGVAFADEAGADRMKAAVAMFDAVLSWHCKSDPSKHHGASVDWVSWFNSTYRYSSKVGAPTTTFTVSATHEVIATPAVSMRSDEQAKPAQLWNFFASFLRWLLTLIGLGSAGALTTQFQRRADLSLLQPAPPTSPASASSPEMGFAVVELPSPSASVDDGTSEIGREVRVNCIHGEPTLRSLTMCVVSDTHSFETKWPRMPLADILVHCGDFCNGYRGTATEAK